MITKQQIVEALHPIQDPELQTSLIELNLIRDIMLREGSVHLTVVLTPNAEPLKDKWHHEATAALHRLGLQDIHIRFRPITEFEQAELSKKIVEDELKKGNEGAAELDEMQIKTQAELRAQSQGIPPLLSPESKTAFIVVASGKGGVGKSTVTVNLAVALARKGKKVGIIDADIYGFSIPDMMGIDEAPRLVNESIVPVEKHGVKVISMGFFVEDNAPVIWRGPMLGKMLRNFFNEVTWGELDYLLLDLPPGTGDVALDVHQMIPQSKEIIVTTPHATAAFVAARAGAMAKHTNHDIIGVVENMAYYECGSCGNKDYIFGRGGGAKLAEELHTKLLAQIPLGAPDNHPSEPDYSPSIYKADTSIAQMYLEVAEHIIQARE